MACRFPNPDAGTPEQQQGRGVGRSLEKGTAVDNDVRTLNCGQLFTNICFQQVLYFMPGDELLKRRGD